MNRPTAIITLSHKLGMPVLAETLNRQGLPPRPFWHMITDHGVTIDASLCRQDHYGDTIYYNAKDDKDSCDFWRSWLIAQDAIRNNPSAPLCTVCRQPRTLRPHDIGDVCETCRAVVDEGVEGMRGEQ